MITAKGCPKHTMFWLYMWRNNDTPYREAISHAFCHGIYIGIYVRIVMRKEFTRPAIAALHTVCYIHGAVFITSCTYGLQEFLTCNINTPYALYAFSDYR